MKKFLLIATALLTTIATTQAASVEYPPSDGSDFLVCRSARGEDEPSMNPAHYPPKLFEAIKRSRELARQKDQVMCDEIKRKQAAERKEWEAAQAAKLERRKVEAELDRKRREEEAAEAQEQARIANLPINRLYRGYQLYALVKFCNEVREGYLVQYVNDTEMVRAKKAIKSIVDQAIKDDTTIDTDDVWKQALAAVQGKSASINFCQYALGELFNLSPTAIYTVAKP